MTRVVLLRGRSANPWELRTWEALGDGYEVAVVVPDSNDHDVSGIGLEVIPARTVSSRVPDPLVRLPGDRYRDFDSLVAGADVVHAAELAYWFSWQAARAKASLGYRLVLTVWETLPFLGAYRNVRTRRYREDVLGATDLFLPTTERAASALRLEGADPARTRVVEPGIDAEAFAAARTPPSGPPVVLTVARLVWEKGVQDLLRAVALLGRGDVQVVVVGEGPHRRQLERHARELGVPASFRGNVPYAELPGLYAQASCLYLGSLPIWSWEEQFGMVLAEAMAAHLPIVASASGAIPEVLGGAGRQFTPGDWVALAGVLGETLDGPARVDPGPIAERYTTRAAAERLRAAYGSL